MGNPTALFYLRLYAYRHNISTTSRLFRAMYLWACLISCLSRCCCCSLSLSSSLPYFPFPTKKTVTQALTKKGEQPSLPICFVAGASAGAAYWGPFYPLEAIKSRMQVRLRLLHKMIPCPTTITPHRVLCNSPSRCCCRRDWDLPPKWNTVSCSRLFLVFPRVQGHPPDPCP